MLQWGCVLITVEVEGLGMIREGEVRATGPFGDRPKHLKMMTSTLALKNAGVVDW
jgi:hypothetical protein